MYPCDGRSITIRTMARNFEERCSVEGCERPVWVRKRGWCSMHYQRWQKHGDPTVRLQTKFFGTAEEAWEHYTVERDGHLIWTGPRGSGSRGQYGRMPRTKQGAHRYAWERVHGPLPPGAVVDHDPECPKTCVDVEHLQVLTPSEHAGLGWERGEIDGGWGPASNYARRGDRHDALS